VLHWRTRRGGSWRESSSDAFTIEDFGVFVIDSHQDELDAFVDKEARRRSEASVEFDRRMLDEAESEMEEFHASRIRILSLV